MTMHETLPLLNMEGPLDFLGQSWAQDRFPHALIFKGPAGVGKKAFGRWLAWKLLQGQGVSPSAQPEIAEADPVYRRLVGGGHGDFLEVSPGEREISTEQAQKVVTFFQKKPMEGAWRVVLVDQAQKMNRFGANKILKILEEPPEKCLLILCVDAGGALLPTLSSRCQEVAFTSLAREEFRQILSRLMEENLKPEEEGFLYRLSNGSPGFAAQIYEAQGHQMMREFLGTFVAFNGQMQPIISFVRQWEKKANEAAYSLFPQLIFTWMDHGLRGLLEKQITGLTTYEQAALKQFRNREHILQCMTALLQSPPFFKRSDVFYLDRGATLYTFFDKLFFTGATWQSHSTSRPLFSM